MCPLSVNPRRLVEPVPEPASIRVTNNRPGTCGGPGEGADLPAVGAQVVATPEAPEESPQHHPVYVYVVHDQPQGPLDAFRWLSKPFPAKKGSFFFGRTQKVRQGYSPREEASIFTRSLKWGIYMASWKIFRSNLISPIFT